MKFTGMVLTATLTCLSMTCALADSFAKEDTTPLASEGPLTAKQIKPLVITPPPAPPAPVHPVVKPVAPTAPTANEPETEVTATPVTMPAPSAEPASPEAKTPAAPVAANPGATATQQDNGHIKSAPTENAPPGGNSAAPHP